MNGRQPGLDSNTSQPINPRNWSLYHTLSISVFLSFRSAKGLSRTLQYEIYLGRINVRVFGLDRKTSRICMEYLPFDYLGSMPSSHTYIRLSLWTSLQQWGWLNIYIYIHVLGIMGNYLVLGLEEGFGYEACYSGSPGKFLTVSQSRFLDDSDVVVDRL